jgi:type VI secretion system secreted protein Hcp
VALDIFLKVAGIKGESTDDQHREEIDVASFSWGLSQQRTTSTGGRAGASKASFQDLHVVTNVSQASPQLFLASAAGRHVETAVLTCRKVGGSLQQDFLLPVASPLLIGLPREAWPGHQAGQS